MCLPVWPCDFRPFRSSRLLVTSLKLPFPPSENVFPSARQTTLVQTLQQIQTQHLIITVLSLNNVDNAVQLMSSPYVEPIHIASLAFKARLNVSDTTLAAHCVYQQQQSIKTIEAR